ncbi:MAG: rod-binding protein [Alphaproteobacteria bacterium]
MTMNNPYIGSGAGNDTTVALMHAAQAKVKQSELERNIAETRKLSQITEKAEEFEALFIAEMLKPMFDGIKTDGLFGGGKTEEIFRSMMLDEYGKAIAKQHSIGIADVVKTELINAQSRAQAQQNEYSSALPVIDIEPELDSQNIEPQTHAYQKEEEEL